jgi:hypothetical protein
MYLFLISFHVASPCAHFRALFRTFSPLFSLIPALVHLFSPYFAYLRIFVRLFSRLFTYTGFL